MEQKEVLGSGNSKGTTNILVANSKGEEIFKLKDDTITINLNNMETKKVTLSNGTVLEVGKKYISTWDEPCQCIKIHDSQCVMMQLDELDEIIVSIYPIHNNWLPYTPPAPQKEWKTFLIEIGWSGYTTREVVQFESLEIAERHYNNAISITEVKLNIEPVNS
tara:strand:- start:752 stop:1240 length:489 start_codon:yes stop_codon:yes gene_type:complete